MDDITEQYIESLECISKEFGSTLAKESFAKELFKLSGEYFAKDKDEIAIIFRNIARLYYSESENELKKHEESLSKRSEIWKILDEAIPNLDWTK